MCMCLPVRFLSLLEVSRTQHNQHESTKLGYRIASPRFGAWAASAKSWQIRRRSHACLYLSTLLTQNLYATLCKTTLMVSNTQQYIPVSSVGVYTRTPCQFQQFLETNSSTYIISNTFSASLLRWVNSLLVLTAN